MSLGAVGSMVELGNNLLTFGNPFHSLSSSPGPLPIPQTICWLCFAVHDDNDTALARGLLEDGVIERATPAISAKESTMIEVRWVVLLALWTLLIGPIFDRSTASKAHSTRNAQSVNHAVKR